MVEKLRVQLYPFIRKCISQIDRIRLLLLLIALLGSSSGVIYGFLLAKASSVPEVPMSWVEDISYTIPTLNIEGYTDDEVVFKTDVLGTRFQMGEQLLSAPPETLFRLKLDPKLRVAAATTGSGVLNGGSSKTGDTAAAATSEACPFVAGTTGKYVYPEADSRAKRLKTRRCFGSQEAAVSAGLLVPEK